MDITLIIYLILYLALIIIAIFTIPVLTKNKIKNRYQQTKQEENTIKSSSNTFYTSSYHWFTPYIGPFIGIISLMMISLLLLNLFNVLNSVTLGLIILSGFILLIHSIRETNFYQSIQLSDSKLSLSLNSNSEIVISYDDISGIRADVWNSKTTIYIKLKNKKEFTIQENNFKEDICTIYYSLSNKLISYWENNINVPVFFTSNLSSLNNTLYYKNSLIPFNQIHYYTIVEHITNLRSHPVRLSFQHNDKQISKSFSSTEINNKELLLKILQDNNIPSQDLNLFPTK